MKQDLATAALVLSGALYSLTSTAVECIAKNAYPDAKLESPYKGGCKGGLANGEGQFSFSAIDKFTKKKVVITVSGSFSDGLLNGEGQYLSSHGNYWQKGTFKNGSSWNTTVVAVGSSAADASNPYRYARAFVQGKQVAFCREDKDTQGCPPELRKILSAKTPPANLPHTQLPAKTADIRNGAEGQSNKVTPNSKSPFTSMEIASACSANNHTFTHQEVIKIEVKSPVKPAQSGLNSMVIPQTDILYPTVIYWPGKYFEGFLYKTPFGLKCIQAGN